ncbi:DUF5682 family protein [Actinoplanes regularis]|uniref:Uncharacterized protein n=1 Tax=Actinoplanes regularis TaxID=52697 RepID=A0A239DDF5_9ACTN|nr:DUF5682 family protein [Actinoplanes regularis]GIE88763.1 hypothetical protein Are01nite_52430 [Actinoplanes regularis]SNS30018.1 hypothetical protein SAMN06264365_11397 [Actinoplanes regularis]
MPERFYGIRHHGPGSARAVLRELAAQQPDILLVEGPPEADELVRWVAADGLEPPVALLGYAADDPARAAYWPFADFSPEWQAIRWAVGNGVPVRFFDLPYAYRVGASDAGGAGAAGVPQGALERKESGSSGIPEGAVVQVGDPPAGAGGPDASSPEQAGSGGSDAPAPKEPGAGGPDTATDSAGEPPVVPGGPDTSSPAQAGSSGSDAPSPKEPGAGGPDATADSAGEPPTGNGRPDASPPSQARTGRPDAPAPPGASRPDATADSAGEPPAGNDGPDASAAERAGAGADHPVGTGAGAGQPEQAGDGTDQPEETRDGAGQPAGDGAGQPVRPVDPIGELAAAAGYDDPERWWEDMVEHRGVPVFEAIAEAMAAIREGAPEDPEDLLREAYMRTVLREVRRRHENIAVVCGAWHVPALTRKVPVKADAALLKGRRKGKVTFTWVPWTYGRLASRSGYGAGVTSPGWYHHLFTNVDSVVPRWLVDAAGVLRAEGVPTSSAHVIEATRLAEALASLRGRPLAGLTEVTEAAEAVMCDGEPLRTELINRRLVVGERLGAVPDEMPVVPLAKDLTAQQRTLRLKPEATERELKLDLRKDIDLRRSRLLHRLRTLDVPWGEPATGRRGTGTFREEWVLRWQPEFAVRLVEGSMWGTTVAGAATARVIRRARAAQTLAEVTALLETCLLAELGEAYPHVLAALDTRAALDADIHHLMAALPALARTLRYGDVRRTDLAGLAAVTASLLKRICAGLPSAAGSLSDDAAKQLRDGIDRVHQAVSLLAEDELRELWLVTVESLARRPDLHGLPAGRLTRLLFDASRLDAAEVRRRLRLPLTIGTPPAHAAAWVEGFLAGGGLLLVHDDVLLGLVDAWLADVPAEAFEDVLPLLRRTFGTFDAGERRAIGERVAGPRAGATPTGVIMIDTERAVTVLPALGALLGREIRIREDQ